VKTEAFHYSVFHVWGSQLKKSPNVKEAEEYPGDSAAFPEEKPLCRSPA
jgi:hypothetical protein